MTAELYLPLPLVLAAGQSPERLNTRTVVVLFAVLGLLGIAQVVTYILRRQPESAINPAQLRTFNRRLGAWWLMCSILVFGFLLDEYLRVPGTVVLFGLTSFWALREFITMTPTRRGDHRTLFWTFFLFTPLQYILVGFGRRFYDVPGQLHHFDFYTIYSILIPVYASLFVPARIAFSGDPKRFLERSAKIQAALLICVYSLSYAPALLDLELMTRDTVGPAAPVSPAEDGTDAPPPKVEPTKSGIPPGWKEWNGSTAGLLFYFVLVVQLGEVLQFAWGKLLGKHVIAPAINASKTWEGFVGGVLSSALVGVALSFMTPFTFWGSATMALIISAMGFAGTMTMSAIKRDRGVRDYGTLVQGHAGVLDRIDSICFAAPVFYHLTRFFLIIEM